MKTFRRIFNKTMAAYTGGNYRESYQPPCKSSSTEKEVLCASIILSEITSEKHHDKEVRNHYNPIGGRTDAVKSRVNVTC